MKKILYFIFAALVLLPMASCNKFLDVMPDNRAELDTAEKIGKFLTDAYGGRTFYTIAELSSDNMDYFGERYTDNKFQEETCWWQDSTESGNADSPHAVWENYYRMIAVANIALAAIEELGDTQELAPYKGEALIARAYNHFVLANIFCQHYDPATAGSNLGIPYMDEPEKDLQPASVRPTLAYTYKRIEEDLIEGLPLIRDDIYDVPKYHFNRNAALAFAARFYQYKAEWPKVIKYTNDILGNNASSFLRDWAEVNSAPGGASSDKARMYYDASKACNFFIRSAYSRLGRYFVGYSDTYKFSHGIRIAEEETIRLKSTPWGGYSSTLWKYNTASWSNTSRVAWYKNVVQTQIANPLTGSVYVYCTTVEFWADETLLTRAEAYIMNGDYDLAMADLNMWAKNIMRNAPEITINQVNTHFNPIEYYQVTEDLSKINTTPKRKLNPVGFTIEETTNNTKENMIHLLLWARRVETIHQGLRWFDIKRYGIDIYRIQLSSHSDATTIVGWKSLLNGDDRRAIQLPQDVIKSGLQANPRDNILSPRF